VTAGDHRAACIDATERWARRFRPRPRRFAELIDGVETQPIRYSRLATVIVRKQPVWRSREYKGRKKPVPPPVMLEAVDPWNPAPDLAEQSLHIRECDSCGGAKNVICTVCAGLAQVTCHGCGGRGRVQSPKSGNIINCKSCRGTGQRKCGACKSGQVPCGKCDKSGKLESWIEIETSQRGHVGVWPTGTHVSVHPGLSELSDVADGWAGAITTEFVARPRSLTADEFGPGARELGWPGVLKQPGILPPGDYRLDRITRQVLSVYEIPRSQVRFSFAGKAGYLNLFGLIPTPTAECDTAPFVRYRRGVVTSAVLSFVLGVYLLGSYSGRGDYYGTHGFGTVFFSLIAAAVGGTWSVARWRRRSTADGARDATLADRIPLALTGAGLLVVALTWLIVGPKPERASAALDAGDLATAKAEILALEHERPNDEEVSELWLRWLTTQLDDATDQEAIELILETIAAEARLRGELASQLETRRMRVLESAALEANLALVQAQVHAILNEADGPDELRRVTTAVASLGLGIAAKELEGKHHEQALALIGVLPDQLPDPAQSRSRDELKATGLRARAAACDEPDLVCKATALHEAVQIDPSERSKSELDALAAVVITQADTTIAESGEATARLEALDGVRSTVEPIAQITAREDLKDAMERLTSSREEILAATPMFGESVAYATVALGQEHLVDRNEGRWQLVDDERLAGADVYLLTDEREAVTGIYIVGSDRRSQALDPAVLNRALMLLLHAELATTPSHNKTGIRHTKTKAGKHQITLGWDGPELVEAWTGEFKP
jgi:hypothetical protein